MGTKLTKLQPGSDIDSWCGKCKLMLAHTIEAMVGDKPARVHCNTCQSQHSYKPNPPEEGSRPGRKRAESESPDRPTPKKRVSRYQSLLNANNAASVKIYSPKDKYEAGDVLEHPTFGRGITTAVKDSTKIEVLFESGSKTLVYGR